MMRSGIDYIVKGSKAVPFRCRNCGNPTKANEGSADGVVLGAERFYCQACIKVEAATKR